MNTHPCSLCNYREDNWCKVSDHLSFPPWTLWHPIYDDAPENYEDCHVASYHTCPKCETKLSNEGKLLQQCSNCDWSA